MTFESLFPDSDYRHQLSVKRGDIPRFFASGPGHEDIIAERRRWLAESPQNYAAAFETALPMIDETTRMLAVATSGDSLGRMIALGGAIEADVVLLQKSPEGFFSVVAGCVCFPSSWSLPEKLGMPLLQVHSVVPDLNTSIGDPIARFLGKIQPGAAWERSNWGLSASRELNQHPSRKMAPLQPPANADQIWLRVENQILTILPETKGLLFGIHVVTQSLEELRDKEPRATDGLRRALETMPEEMARYKNISAVRADVISLLS